MEMKTMSNKTMINSFLALLSLKIAEIEKLFGKNFDPTYVEILIVDELPTKEQKSELETDLSNILINQGWKINYFKIVLEKPARIIVSFQISP